MIARHEVQPVIQTLLDRLLMSDSLALSLAHNLTDDGEHIHT